MTLGSWLYMLTVWGIIVALNVFCFSRIFAKKLAVSSEEERERDA